MTQPAPGSAFDVQWLRLRESTDHAARDAGLMDRAREWLTGRQRAERAFSMIDLGSGSGSNLEFLAPRLPGPQRWRLVDQDAGLLAQAASRYHSMSDADGTPLELIVDCRNLAELDKRLLDGSDLVCGSALFDLVSQAWVEHLVAACAAQRAAVLFTLSVSGDWSFLDSQARHVFDAEDTWVGEQIRAHQQRDKGFGPALAGDAPRALAEALERHGYCVANAPSPWYLYAGRFEARLLGRALLDGWTQAAHEQAPHEKARLQAWLTSRRQSLDDGMLGVYVGHVDIFAHPRQAT